MNEDQPIRRNSRREARIACQDNTVFGRRDAQNFVVFEPVGVKDVEAQDPQPAGQTADHDIRDQSGFCSLLH